MSPRMRISNAALRTSIDQTNQQHQIEPNQHHRGGQIHASGQTAILAILRRYPRRVCDARDKNQPVIDGRYVIKIVASRILGRIDIPNYPEAYFEQTRKDQIVGGG